MPVMPAGMGRPIAWPGVPGVGWPGTPGGLGCPGATPPGGAGPGAPGRFCVTQRATTSSVRRAEEEGQSVE